MQRSRCLYDCKIVGIFQTMKDISLKYILETHSISQRYVNGKYTNRLCVFRWCPAELTPIVISRWQSSFSSADMCRFGHSIASRIPGHRATINSTNPSLAAKFGLSITFEQISSGYASSFATYLVCSVCFKYWFEICTVLTIILWKNKLVIYKFR